MSVKNNMVFHFHTRNELMTRKDGNTTSSYKIAYVSRLRWRVRRLRVSHHRKRKTGPLLGGNTHCL